MEPMNSYQSWLNMFAGDAGLVAELMAIAGDEKEIEDRFYTELEFGTAGMRGVLGAGTNRMNVYNVRRATQGLANYLLRDPAAAGRGVAIGYDSRRFSPEFALESALTLCANGIRVYLYDELRPVALLSFAVRRLNCVAGIVITASHNPKEYNGYKVYGEDGGQFPPEPAAEVLACIRALAYSDARTMPREQAESAGLLTVIGPELDDAYQAMVHQLCIDAELCKTMGESLRIVYTPLNGSGNKPVRRVLREVGFSKVSVVPEQERPDSDFTTVGVPNPENASAFALAIAQAEAEGADLVFGTDPDCDRLGVACKNEAGEYLILSGNQIGCLLLDYIIEGRKRNGTLPANAVAVKSIVSTELARAICEANDVQMQDVLTGFKFIAEQIQSFENQPDGPTFIFGFEESYGYLSGTDVRDKDAVNASLLLAECAAYHKSQGHTLHEGLLGLYAKYGWYLEEVQSLTLSGKDGLEKMRKLMAALRADPPVQVAGSPVTRARDLLQGTEGYPPADVLIYELETGDWLCVRPSGTEPKVKIYYNLVAKPSEAAAKSAVTKLRAGINALLHSFM